MMFQNLPAQHFSQLKKIEDFNNYANGLVLLDDLLCRYDSVPRHPEYLPSGKSLELAGTLEFLSEPIQQCVANITSPDLRSNLERNFETAQELYEERSARQAEIVDFLAELVRQYSEVVHPAVYPDTAG